MLTAVRLLSIVLVVAAIVVAGCNASSDAGAFDPTRFFAFFTIQSNLIGVAAFAWLVASRGNRPRSRGLELLRGAAVVYLTVTFFVVIVLLSGDRRAAPARLGRRRAPQDLPRRRRADWMLDPPMIRLTDPRRRSCGWPSRSPGPASPSSAVRLDGWYPYPFLDPAKGGYGTVAVIVVAITSGSWRSRSSRQPSRSPGAARDRDGPGPA